MSLGVRDIGLLASKAVLGSLALCAIFGGRLARAFPEGSASSAWLQGARTTTLTALVVTVVALAIGLALGAAAALGPRVFDSLLSRAIEVAAAMPSVVVALVVSRVAPTPDFLAVSITLGLLGGLQTAKIVRRELTTLLGTEFAVAARALGSGQMRLFRAHLLPHVLGTAVASATLLAAAVVGLEAALSFLDLASFGPSWGAMIAEAALGGAPTHALAPALGVAVTLLSLYLAGSRVEARFGVGRSFL